MPPYNWPQISVSVTEFALWRSPCSSTLHVADREARGSTAFALLWFWLRKIVQGIALCSM